MARTLSRRPRTGAEDAPGDEAAETTTRRERAFAKGASEGSQKPSIGKGWGAVEKALAASSDYAENFKPSSEEVVIKFLEPEPFAVYRQHWIERDGKRSWTCITSITGEDCPLCDLGDRPRTLTAFNVLDFSDPDSPSVKVWEAASRVTTTIKNYATKEKTKPLNRADLYFSVSRSGKGTSSVTSISPLKARDLSDDFDIEPLSEEDLADYAARVWDESVVQVSSIEALGEIADEIAGA